MTASRPSFRPLAWIFATALALLGTLALMAPAAKAGPLVESAPDCSTLSGSQVFLPWADPASYVLAPGGSFENGTPGWKLGGAKVVSGNESYYVHGSGDSKSLRIPSGKSARSATACVGIGEPTIRFFARNAGSLLSTLKVEVRFEDSLGNVLTAPVGTVVGTSGWQPTPIMPIVANLLPLLPGDYTPVQFKFTPLLSGGDWRIDDVYVDPWRK